VPVRTGFEAQGMRDFETCVSQMIASAECYKTNERLCFAQLPSSRKSSYRYQTLPAKRGWMRWTSAFPNGVSRRCVVRLLAART
jgi:hypothetical protein